MTVRRDEKPLPLVFPEKDRGILSGVTSEIETAVRRAERLLGDASQAVFFLVDGLQRSATDTAFDIAKAAALDPANLLSRTSEAISQLSYSSRFVVPSSATRLALREVGNKLEAFALVKNLGSVLHWSPVQESSLPKLVEKAYSFPAWEALFAVEGVGKYYAETAWAQGGPPVGLLSASQAQVPAKSLLMLHAGMGLAFAYRLLAGLTSQSSSADISGVIEEFIDLCNANSCDGYLGSAVECLGFITREFYPDTVISFHQNLQIVAPEFSGFFWHGVGRACYFSRSNFLPFSHNPLSWVERESSWAWLPAGSDRDLAQYNTMAGIAWATTAVNTRYPEIVAEVIRASIVNSNLKQPFADGIRSTLVMRADTTPDDPLINAFYQYQPDSSDPALMQLWKDLIAGPCDDALRTSYPRLRDHQQLDQLFQYSAAPVRDILPDPNSDK